MQNLFTSRSPVMFGSKAAATKLLVGILSAFATIIVLAYIVSFLPP